MKTPFLIMMALFALVLVVGCDRLALPYSFSTAWDDCYSHGDWKDSAYCEAAARSMPDA